MSVKLILFNIVGPSAGHRSSTVLLEWGSRTKVVGFEDETSLDIYTFKSVKS